MAYTKCRGIIPLDPRKEAWDIVCLQDKNKAQEAEIKRLLEYSSENLEKLFNLYEVIAPLLGLKPYKAKGNSEQIIWANSKEEADSLRLGRSIYTFVEAALKEEGK